MFKVNIIPNHKEDSATIQVALEDKPYYSNLDLSTLYVDTINTVTKNGPSSSALSFNVGGGSIKETTIDVSKDLQLSVNKMPLFFYMEASGILSKDTPCGKDTMKEYLGYTFNTEPLYKALLCQFENIKNCALPTNLATDYLKIKALEASLNTEQLDTFKELYKKYYNDIITNNETKTCSCTK